MEASVSESPRERGAVGSLCWQGQCMGILEPAKWCDRRESAWVPYLSKDRTSLMV